MPNIKSQRRASSHRSREAFRDILHAETVKSFHHGRGGNGLYGIIIAFTFSCPFGEQFAGIKLRHLRHHLLLHAVHRFTAKNHGRSNMHRGKCLPTARRNLIPVNKSPVSPSTPKRKAADPKDGIQNHDACRDNNRPRSLLHSQVRDRKRISKNTTREIRGVSRCHRRLL